MDNLVERYLNEGRYCVEIMWSNGNIKEKAEVCDANRFSGTSMSLLSRNQKSTVTPKDFYLYIISRYKEDPIPVKYKGKHFKVKNTMNGTDVILSEGDKIWKEVLKLSHSTDDWYEKNAENN
jgi:hypothetical protein